MVVRCFPYETGIVHVCRGSSNIHFNLGPVSLLGRVAGFYGSIRLRPAGSPSPEMG
ncbi:hypothetical protein L3Y25_gp045 [Gordonia phage Syleon]|uniref:Uncharacterized protein n=1 Tax=Gordonia phage Syleon TaxID=2653718 RepID=A0A5Q2WFY1_9CAUD|nr:hypothetical protein L3Y25_gp045 [Gordonia phage Syleon]QGH75774.1 hypothetical protein SEA_SYLEON_45 [Gordonia phage Syleon]